MGWKAPTKAAFKPGEIPGKGRISDEQSERIDKFAPKNNVEKFLGLDGGDITDFQQQALNDIIAIGESDEIMAFLDDLIENHPTPEIVVNVFDPNYEHNLRIEYNNAKLTATFDDTFEVAKKRFIMPKVFYFGIGDATGNGDINVVITPITTWNENKTRDFPEYVDMVAPEFLTKVSDSVYELEDGMSPSKARKEMLARGFVEQHEIV